MKTGFGVWTLALGLVACGAANDADTVGSSSDSEALAAAAKVGWTRFGSAISPRSDARMNDLSAQFGGLHADRAYDGGNGVAPFLGSIQAMDLRHDVASAFSFKYQPSQVTAGAHDAELRQFFQGIADNHPTFWTYWHEPDDDIYVKHAFTPAQYRAAWAHIKAIANQVKAGRPNLIIHATLIIMEYSMTDKIAPSRPLLGPNGMYPGDDVIDVFGVDAYNGPADKGQIVDAATQFGRVIDFAQAHHKPWAIGELGSCDVAGNPNGRATYLHNALSYFKSRQYTPAYVTYFNLDWPVCDYRLDGDAAATAVWRDAMVHGYANF